MSIVVWNVDSRQSLLSLNMRFNNIGSAGIAAIISSLSVHNAITSLNASANRIGPDGGQALAIALQRNSSLISLDLFGNELEVCIPWCVTLNH